MGPAQMFLWGVVFTASALACSVEKNIAEDTGGDADAGPLIQLDQEFAFAGQTAKEGDYATAFLPYTILVDAETAAAWQFTVTSSDCAISPEAVDPVIEIEANTFTSFSGKLKAGENHLALTVVTAEPCSFEGKATLARGSSTEAIQLGAFVDYDLTTADGGDGKFVAMQEYELSLTSPKTLGKSASSMADGCTTKEYDGPTFLLKTGEGAYEPLPATLPAGDHVVAIMFSSDKSCRVQGSFRLE